MTPAAQAELDKLCASAFDSEYLDDKSLAITQHNQAIAGLLQLEISSVDKERKKMAKKQLKFHRTRLQLLTQASNRNELRLLPTSKTAHDQLNAVDQAPISMDEWRLAQFRLRRQTDPNAEMPADVVHLMATPIPRYTPLLPTFDPSVFDLHVSVEMNGLLGGHFYYVKAKDPATQQTLYVLKVLKTRTMQIWSASFYRAAEFIKPAIVINIRPVDMHKVGSKPGGSIGRNLVINNGLSVIEEKMDRQLKLDWAPRRFSYGGRQFVWRNRPDSRLRGFGPMDLHETIRVWPKPGSKTGKMLDEVVPERLSWGQNKARHTSMSQVSIKGGIDQFFMEYILASQMTKQIIQIHGHR